MQFSFGEQEHLTYNQLIVMKGKHHDQCSDNTAKLEYFPMERGFFPNAKLYCVNLYKLSSSTEVINLLNNFMEGPAYI